MLLKSDMSNRKKRAHLEHCLSHQYTIIVHGNCLWKLMIHHAAKHLFVSFTHHDCTGNDVPYSPSRASGVGFSGAGENPTACHHHRRRWYVKPQVSSWAQNPNLKKCDLKRPGWVNQIQIRYRFFWDSTWQLAEAIRVHRFRLQWIPSWNPCPAIRQCSSFPVSLNDRRVYMVYMVYPHSWWCACCLISLFSPIIFLLHLWYLWCLLKPPTNPVTRFVKNFIRQGLPWEPPASHCTYDDPASHSSSPPSSQASKLAVDRRAGAEVPRGAMERCSLFFAKPCWKMWEL